MLRAAGRMMLSLLPLSFSDKIRAFRNRRFRNYFIQEWEKAGKPTPPPHQIKQLVLEECKALYGCNVLVETGTFKGDMIEAERNNFGTLYSVELSPVYWEKAVKRFKKYNHIKIIQGDSAFVLDSITKDLNEKAVFWLDGHYSALDTARGAKDCPIMGEIDAIFRYKKLNHILIIDDAGSFNGTGDYPTIAELDAYVKLKDPAYKAEVKDGIIRYTINGN